MSSISVRLLGRFCVRRDQELLQGLDARRLQELLCYLLLHRRQAHSRETLAGVLWPEASTEQSRKYLRSALWQLQTALDTALDPNAGPVLLVEPDWVSVNLQASFSLDVAAFEEAFALAQEVPPGDLDPHRVQVIEAAAQLYRGELLEGCYVDWCLCERERLQQMFLSLLDKLMGYCEAHQKYEAGVAYGLRTLTCDPAAERTHRRLMRLHYLAGDRTAALRQYERCVAALDQELGAKPSGQTKVLYEQILADQLDGGSFEASMLGRAHELPAEALPDLLTRLKQLLPTLVDLQRQVQQQIQAVELTLKGRS
jgi:DNA-binding SARP family transcriptional activator